MPDLYKPEIISVINDDGYADPAVDPEISNDDLLKYYRLMLLVRIMEENLLDWQRQGRIGFYAPCTGQEACHIAAAAAIEDRDWIFAQYREPGAILLRGWPLRTFFAQTLGNSEDIMKGRQMPDHFGDPEMRFVTPSSPIGTQISQAVGAAMAAKLKGDDVISLVYFGDGATSSSGFHDGLNFAGVFKAPVIFFCQNNQYAISLPLEKQTASENIAIKGQAYGMEGIRVDGNDFPAVYKAVKYAADKARNGGGPTLIEAVTYRLGPHSSSDDPSRYRTRDEEKQWWQKDPIVRFENYLRNKGLLQDDYIESLRASLQTTISETFREAEMVEPPHPETLFDDVYDHLTWNLEEQKQELIHYALGEGGRCPWQI
ncbi:MAG: pyruvate dehydrogenase (acetyl-transferring) E1 component subunit alpha [Firmicutes bacterium]|nr:pyruvate dehydrogenase (acetyl-transferring) E1 component subunit alpha [Bacillota bacterium]